MLSGGVEPEYVTVTFDIDVGVQLAEILNDVSSAAISCESSISPLVQQYKQTSLQHKRSHFVHLIENQYQRALRGCCPAEMLLPCVDFMTHLALCDINLYCVDADYGFTMYLHVKTVKAVCDLREMLRSYQLNRLLENMFSAFSAFPNISGQLEYQLVSSR